MQNKKEGFRRSTNLHVTYRETSEAAEASGGATQPILSTRATPSLFLPLATLVYIFSLRLSSPSLSPLSQLSNLPTSQRTCISR